MKRSILLGVRFIKTEEHFHFHIQLKTEPVQGSNCWTCTPRLYPSQVSPVHVQVIGKLHLSDALFLADARDVFT